MGVPVRPSRAVFDARPARLAPLAAFVVRRVVRLIGVLAAITVVSFGFMHAIPGDPVALRLGDHATPEEVRDLRATFGLDKPAYVQLALYLVQILHGDLGRSLVDSPPVAPKLGRP